MDIHDAEKLIGRERLEEMFQEVKNDILKMFEEKELTKFEKLAECVMRKHMWSVMGVVRHGVWNEMRADIAELIWRAFYPNEPKDTK